MRNRHPYLNPLLLRSISSISTRPTPSSSNPFINPNPNFVTSSPPPLLFLARLLSTSSPLTTTTTPPTSTAAIADIFSKPTTTTLQQVNSLDLTINSVNAILSDLKSNPEIASRFFNFLSETNAIRLNSKSHNSMLEILAATGKSEEFWDLVEKMKKKGFGVSKEAFFEASGSFEKRKMGKDLALLKELYFLNSHENVVRTKCAEICKILRSGDERISSCHDEIWGRLEGLGKDLQLSNELVIGVLNQIGQFPTKALLFFKWVDGNLGFRVNGKVLNRMARVVAREDSIEEFWGVLKKMKDGGFELERETFVKVWERFHKRGMILAAADLYRFAMGGVEKPSVQDFLFLLRKVISSSNTDLKLITRVVHIYQSAGNVVKGSNFDAVLKLLRSMGRLGECHVILKAMEDGGFAPDSFVHRKVVLGLCDAKKLDEALKYMEDVEESVYSLDVFVWSNLVQKYALAGDLDMSLSCFHKMVDRKGTGDASSALEALVNGFCTKKGPRVASKVLKDVITKKHVKPWHSTYKYLIDMLISRRKIEEAFGLLGLMKNDGFPPFIDPFVNYISKSGTVDDATGLLKAMSAKEFPSRTVYIQLFEALFKEGRHEVAQELLSKSPGSVRNHADVLDLFYAGKPEEDPVATAL